MSSYVSTHVASSNSMVRKLIRYNNAILSNFDFAAPPLNANLGIFTNHGQPPTTMQLKSNQKHTTGREKLRFYVRIHR
jgi:hypothetical protein